MDALHRRLQSNELTVPAMVALHLRRQGALRLCLRRQGKLVASQPRRVHTFVSDTNTLCTYLF